MANPTLDQYSKAIEQVRTLKELDYVPFMGGMDTYHKVDQLPLAGYSYIQNMRPLRPGFAQRNGCVKLHTTADATNKVMNLYMFSKGKQSENHFLAQMSDGDILEATANPPTVTTGPFGSAVHTSSSPSTMLTASFSVSNDRLLYADGTGVPYINSGNNEKVTGFIVYKGAETIPSIPQKGEDYTIEVTDEDATTYADLDSLDTLANYDCVFLKTDTPANLFTWTILNANGSAAVSQMHYWNGAWTSVSAFADTTATGGATMAVTGGTTAFTMPTDMLPTYMFGQCGYWYRLSLASGVLDSDTKVSEVRYNSTWMPVQNTWDGVPVQAIEAYVYIDSTKTFNYYVSTDIEITGLTSADKVYFNSYDQAVAFYVSVGNTPNETASTTLTTKYWNGTGWSAHTNMSDGTIEDSKSFAKDAWITVTRPTDEQMSMFQSSQYFSYWYEFSFDKTITSAVGDADGGATKFSIETMPHYDLKDFGNCISLSSFQQRMSYGFENLPGFVAISAAGAPMCLNGDDYVVQEIGDGRSNKAVCQKKFYNELMVWQEEKGTDGGCLTLIEGSTTEDINKRIISTKHGTFSSKSAVVVEDVPTQSNLSVDSSGQLTQVPSNATVAFFISRDGVFSSNGKTVNCVSQKIQNHFDNTDSSDCIRRGYENEHWIDYDPIFKVIRMGLVTGSSATVPNTFLVYDISSGVWSYDSLAQPLSCHCNVEATSGQYPVLQCGGGSGDGTVYQLNVGTTDAGTAIDSYALMEFDGRGHDLNLSEMVLRFSGTCTVTPYEDGVAKTAITFTS